MLLLMVSLLVIGMVLGIPICFCLGLSAALALLFVGDIPMMIIGQMVYAAGDSFALLAIPFFMLAGNIMSNGGISNRLVAFSNIFFGRTTGGMGMVAIATSMFFAAISGSGPATVAALGAIVIPAMIGYKYNRGYAAALMATAGSVGIIIPPSIPMIVYGVQSEISVAKLFMAGIVPGIVFGLALMVLNYFMSRARGYQYFGKGGYLAKALEGALANPAGDSEAKDSKTEASAEEDQPVKVQKCTWDVIFALIMPVIILGGIYSGIFTPTESAGVAVVYGLIVWFFIYRELKIRDLPRIFIEAAVNTAMILLIIMFASLFSFVLITEGAPQALIAMINEFTTNPIVILLLINIFLLFAGCFLDASSAIIVLTPLLLPLIRSIGMDYTHFGVLMIVNLAIWLITPPVGLDLYVGCGIAKISLEAICKAVWPFLAVSLVVLLLITYIPGLSLWLPGLFGY